MKVSYNDTDIIIHFEGQDELPRAAEVLEPVFGRMRTAQLLIDIINRRQEKKLRDVKGPVN